MLNAIDKTSTQQKQPEYIRTTFLEYTDATKHNRRRSLEHVPKG